MVAFCQTKHLVLPDKTVHFSLWGVSPPPGFMPLMAAMQMYLCDKHNVLENANESIWYGLSTQNKIERWWRELFERLERLFKEQLCFLAEKGYYDSTNAVDRYYSE